MIGKFWTSSQSKLANHKMQLLVWRTRKKSSYQSPSIRWPGAIVYENDHMKEKRTWKTRVDSFFLF